MTGRAQHTVATGFEVLTADSQEMANTHTIPTFGPLRSWPVFSLAVAVLLLAASCSNNGLDNAEEGAASNALAENDAGAEQASAPTPELLANDSSDSAKTERGCENTQTLCIGLAIAPGAIPLTYLVDDLEQIEAKYESIVEVLEAEDVTHLRYKVQDFAEESFDIIVVAGDPTGLLVSQAAADYPETTFVSVEDVPVSAGEAATPDAATATNLVSLSFAYQDSGFLAGALAALTTETGKVAAIIGPDSDPAAAQFKTGFEAGAQFINPQIQLFTSFHPTPTATGYNDPLWASGKTRQVIEQGVDVVVGFGGITGSAALVEAARQSGSVLCIGTVVDHQVMTPEASRCLSGSAEVGLDDILFQTLEALLERDQPITGDVSGAPWTSQSPATLSIVSGGQLSGDVVAQMDEITEALHSGTLSSN